MIWALLGGIGIFVGAFGTLIGAAGGFILVPILLFLYPEAKPATITSITLAVAFFNALGGSIAYGRFKRIDYHSGLLFSLCGIPGAILGASITTFLSRGVFQYVFGVFLIIIAAYLLIRPERTHIMNPNIRGQNTRKLTDRENHIYIYSFNRFTGMAIAFVVGFIGGLLGIGGGIMHVPALTQVLNFPTHIATATSHFVVAVTTLAAVITHIVTGAFIEGIMR